MDNLPFYLYQRNRSPYWYVRINGTAYSTKKTNRNEAAKVAVDIYARNSQKDKVRKTIRFNELSDESLLELINECKKRHLIVSAVISDRTQVKAYDFISDFWNWETSPYIREKLRKEHSIHRKHADRMKAIVENMWKDFLKDRYLSEVTRKDLTRFCDEVIPENVSYHTKNQYLHALTLPLKWATQNGILERNVAEGFVYYSGEYRKREILTPEIADALFRIKWNDGRCKLANLLAMCTGLRAGEIQALRLCDIGENCLYVRHAWTTDGMKTTKNNTERTVFVSFPVIIEALKTLGFANPYNKGLEGFIFWGALPDKPIDEKFFISGLRNALVEVGMTPEETKKYFFHGWRHYYTSYMVNSLSDRLVQSQTGHKTKEMLEHYADHEHSADSKEIMAVQQNTFGNTVDHAGDLFFNWSDYAR